MQKATSFWDSQANQIIDWKSMLLKVYEQLEKRKKTTFLHSPTVLRIVKACSLELLISPTDHCQECLH